MKLYRAIVRDTERDVLTTSKEVFENEDQATQWYQDQKTFHETWQLRSTEKGQGYAPFNLLLVGLEEVDLSINF